VWLLVDIDWFVVCVFIGLQTVMSSKVHYELQTTITGETNFQRGKTPAGRVTVHPATCALHAV
jgi:hypothetical protein